MNAKHVLLALAAIAVAAGCQKTPEPKTATRASGESSSVAMPADKLPPSDGSLAPQASSGASGTVANGQAGTPTQARPTELTKHEEQTQLPKSGQTNNYSPPETTGEQANKKEK